MILQQEVTLDEAMVDGFKTYLNGCNFKLRTKQDGSRWLEYGCYCLVNLLTGKEKLLSAFRSAAALSKHWAQSLCPVSSVSRRILSPDRPAAGNRHNGSTLGPYPAIGGFSPSLCSPWLGD